MFVLDILVVFFSRYFMQRFKKCTGIVIFVLNWNFFHRFTLIDLNNKISPALLCRKNRMPCTTGATLLSGYRLWAFFPVSRADFPTVLLAPGRVSVR